MEACWETSLKLKKNPYGHRQEKMGPPGEIGTTLGQEKCQGEKNAKRTGKGLLQPF